MSIESSADWDGLRAVSSVVSHTLGILARAVEPGVTTAELDGIAATFLQSSGARSAPADVYGFPGTVLISVNEEVVHEVPGRRVVRIGDLVRTRDRSLAAHYEDTVVITRGRPIVLTGAAA